MREISRINNNGTSTATDVRIIARVRFLDTVYAIKNNDALFAKYTLTRW